MLQLRELLLFTSAGEFSISGPNGAFPADNPIITQFGYSGSSALRPLVVEDTALFCDRTGSQVRDLRYAFEQDGYSGSDLTIYAFHFFEGKRIIGWAYAKNPFFVVWAALDDGTLLSLTYKREHQVFAWCEHDLSGGKVEQVVSITENDYDVIYMVVRRVINGETKRYVERLTNRQFVDIEDAYFVDCGVRYDGPATVTIGGLAHLEGETVVALADGNVVQNLVVSGGTVALPRAASKVSVGLPYYAEIETLPPPVELPDVGSARGRPHKISKIQAQVQRTRGIKAGYDRAKLNEIVQTKRDLAAPIQDATDFIPIQLHPNWNRDGTVVVRQDYPLPMTVLGISPEYTVGRTSDG